MTRKEDKRKRKTKSAVCNAVMTLLTKKSLDKISIKEISEEADINRATFYLHFNDAKEVVDYIEEYASNRIKEVLSSYENFSDIKNNPYSLIKEFGTELVSNPGACSYILGTDYISSPNSKIKQTLIDGLLELALKEFPRLEKSSVEISLSFMIAGSLEAYKTWMQSENQSSFEEVCFILSNLFKYGSASIFPG